MSDLLQPSGAIANGPKQHRRRPRRVGRVLVGVAAVYVLLALGIAPFVGAEENPPFERGGSYSADSEDDREEIRREWARKRARQERELAEIRRKSQQESHRHRVRVSWARQWLVGLRGFSGTYWVGQHDNPDRLATTNSTGAALRFTRGIGHPFAFEFDASVGRTGQVTFDTGETRSANFVRVKTGLVIRLAHSRLAPLVHGGLGVQGTTYSPDNNPEEDFEAHFMYYIGVGLNFRVTRRFVAGLSASFDKAASERSVHGGLHLNVGWGR